MAEQGAQEKTEAPTVRRREEGRKEGMVAISREVPSAALLGAFALYFLVLGDTHVQDMQQVWVAMIGAMNGPDLTIGLAWRFFRGTVLLLTPAMLGLFGLAMVVAALASVLQVGFVLNPLKPRPERLDPIRGFQRIFSAQGAAELFKSLFKMTVIGWVTYISYAQEILPLLTLSRLPLRGIFEFNFALLGTLFGRVALALVVLAIFDYLFQRWQLEQRLKMTKQEMKEELRQTEGDPQLRARVRQVQREMSNARMMEKVPKADVVVTNPTHFAVALMYDREVMGAPQVVAKGADYLARRIREVAQENEVPLVENPLVARELYNNVEIGQEIPEEFFRAVAEILAYVYRLQGRTVAPPA